MSAKKCIVLDLDNTLWGGTVGEDGPDGIKLGISEPGASFVAFQQALLDLYHRGILLAINSANNVEDAMQVIRSNPNMILKEQHFTAVRINWNDKTQNIREIANEINIGLDACVFLDDSPQNRALMRSLVPEVATPELPLDPAEYVKFLLLLDYFESDAITDEDKMRGNLYVTERLRQEAEKGFSDKASFLKSLGMEFFVYRDRSTSIERLAQLTEKTNQFNVQKRPMSVEDMRAAIERADTAVFSGNVIDRFGDAGIIALAIVRKGPDTWHIESFMLSCRVIGRGVESALLYAIAQAAIREGAKRLTINFVPTEKNAPAAQFVSTAFVDQVVLVDDVKLPEWITLHTYDI